jgi:hypothetical protein
VAQFWAHCGKLQCGVMLGGGGCGSMTWGGGCVFANMRPGGQKPKPSVGGSILGVLCEMAVWDDARRWWVWVNDMEAAGELCVHQHKARGWGLGQNPKLSISGSVSGVPCETAVCSDAGR